MSHFLDRLTFFKRIDGTFSRGHHQGQPVTNLRAGAEG